MASANSNATENRACRQCAHRDVCKYAEMIPKIKEEYPFISGITCAYCVKKNSAGYVEQPSEEPEKPKVTDKPTEQKVPEKGTGRPVEKSTEKPATDTGKKEPGKEGTEDDKEMSMLSIDLQKLGVKDDRTLVKLRRNHINTLGDLYRYKDAAMNILSSNEVTQINGILSAFNQKTL